MIGSRTDHEACFRETSGCGPDPTSGKLTFIIENDQFCMKHVLGVLHFLRGKVLLGGGRREPWSRHWAAEFAVARLLGVDLSQRQGI